MKRGFNEAGGDPVKRNMKAIADLPCLPSLRVAFILLLCVIPGFLGAQTQTADEAERMTELAKKFDTLSQEGRYAEALPLGADLIAFCEKSFGANHENTATVMQEVAALHQNTGDVEQAEALYRKSLRIFRTAKKDQTPQGALVMTNLGGLCTELERFSEAETLFKEALSILEKDQGAGQEVLTAMIHNGLGATFQAQGDVPQAEAAYVRAVNILEELPEEQAHFLPRLVGNLGGLHLTSGNFAKAEPFILRAVELGEKRWPEGHPEQAHGFIAQAVFKSSLGDQAGARQLQDKALKLIEDSQGAGHHEIALVLFGLADSAYDRGDYAESATLLGKAVALTEKSLGAKHIRMSFLRASLGRSQGKAKDFAAAKASLDQALAISLEARTQQPAIHAYVLVQQGVLAADQGDHETAEARFQEALPLLEKTVGPRHPDTVLVLDKLTLTAHRLNQPEKARERAARWDAAARQAWDSLLAFTSEAQREAVQGTEAFQTFDTAGTLGDGAVLAEAALWRKGSLLESLIEDRLVLDAVGADPALVEKQREADSLKGRLRQALMESQPAGKGSQVREVEETRVRLELLQKDLARGVASHGQARLGLKTSLASIQAALPPGSALVEMVRYRHQLERGESEPRYAAAVIPPLGLPVYVSLGQAGPLEGLIEEVRELSATELKEGETSASRDARLERKSRELYTAIGEPLERALPKDSTAIILSPDASLHFVPFAALVDAGGRLWGETRVLHSVATGRDLLKTAGKGFSAPATAVLLGNPDYRQEAVGTGGDSGGSKKIKAQKPAATPTTSRAGQERLASSLRAGLDREARALSFSALPGTAAEVAALGPKFEAKGWKARVLTGSGASEPALRSLEEAPAILHLATHGFFLGQGEEIAGLRGQDAMLRSGLALASAQRTAEQWATGQVSALDQDGILTAAEAAGLKLADTQLVTLSACETGLGEARNGEGILGLKRGFAVAGAKNLLMTLWEISDDDTVALMAAFYDRVLGGETPAAALAAVQAESLARLRKEHGLYHAVNRAAPFVLVSGTALPDAPLVAAKAPQAAAGETQSRGIVKIQENVAVAVVAQQQAATAAQPQVKLEPQAKLEPVKAAPAEAKAPKIQAVIIDEPSGKDKKADAAPVSAPAPAQASEKAVASAAKPGTNAGGKAKTTAAKAKTPVKAKAASSKAKGSSNYGRGNGQCPPNCPECRAEASRSGRSGGYNRYDGPGSYDGPPPGWNGGGGYGPPPSYQGGPCR